MERQKRLVAFGHNKSLKTPLELQKQPLLLPDISTLYEFGTLQNCT